MIRHHFDPAPGLPPVIGHYCHATELPNGLILLSGQKAWDAEGRLAQDGIEAETKLAFQNVLQVLRQLGLSLEAIARVTCYLATGVDYGAFNRAYSEALGAVKPARAVLGGHDLRGGALVELVVEAWRPLGAQQSV